MKMGISIENGKASYVQREDEDGLGSRSSLDVRIWGPEAWNFMHAVTFAYPKEHPSNEDKENISLYFKYIGKNLPCERCRYHFGKILQTHPIDTKNRETISRWLVDRHNDVNLRLGKPTLPYDFVKKKYEDMENTCPLGEKKIQNCKCPNYSGTANPLQTAIIWCLVTFIILLILAISVYVISKTSWWNS